jgi:hypothetical protein
VAGSCGAPAVCGAHQATRPTLQAAYVWCLGTYGVGHDRALAFALLVLAVTLASSAMGGIVYAVAGRQVRAGR